MFDMDISTGQIKATTKVESTSTTTQKKNCRFHEDWSLTNLGEI
jgi:hypothetical protein